MACRYSGNAGDTRLAWAVERLRQERSSVRDSYSIPSCSRCRGRYLPIGHTAPGCLMTTGIATRATKADFDLFRKARLRCVCVCVFIGGISLYSLADLYLVTFCFVAEEGKRQTATKATTQQAAPQRRPRDQGEPSTPAQLTQASSVLVPQQRLCVGLVPADNTHCAVWVAAMWPGRAACCGWLAVLAYSRSTYHQPIVAADIVFSSSAEALTQELQRFVPSVTTIETSRRTPLSLPAPLAEQVQALCLQSQRLLW